MRYRCLNEETNCPTFECDYVPYECPNCGYTCTERVDDNDGGNLDDPVADNHNGALADNRNDTGDNNRNDAGACKRNNFLNKKFIIAFIALALVLIGIILYYYFNQSIKIDMKYNESKCRLEFTIVESVINKNREDYKIDVYCDNKIFDSIFFDGDSHAYYGDERMIDGVWYEFFLKRIDGDDIEMKKMGWSEKDIKTEKYELKVSNNSGRFRLVGDNEVSQNSDTDQSFSTDDSQSFKTLLSCNPKPILEKKQYEITIEENGKPMSGYEGLKFECEGKEYDSNPFYISAPDKDKNIEITVSASNISKSSVILVNVEPISEESEKQKVSPALTKEDVQSIIDDVTDGKNSSGYAQGKLARGSVFLKKPVGNGIITLWDVLVSASVGYKFEVVSFEIDTNTNKIKSGTLEVVIVE